MNTGTATTVRVARHLDAPAERAFDAWLDEATAGQWLFATPAGRMVRVAIDPGVGGTFTLVDRRDGEDVEHTGEYVVVDRPCRLAFDFVARRHGQDAPDATRVTVDFAPAADGCDVALSHEGVPADFAERTADGWRTILDGLASTLARAPAEARGA